MTKKCSFRDAAEREAEKSKFKQKLGAVVVVGSKIVGRGFNFSHSTGQLLHDGMHAEMAALNNTTARFRDGSIVYVCRVMGNGELGLSKPCDRCLTVMKKMNVKRVHFSKDGGWGEILP